MRPVKRVLLGSAAGVFAVAGAQAADLAVKAKPVEYVKVCSLYGAGFWYVPGTDTCIKIGAYAKLQTTYNMANTGPFLLGGASGTGAAPTGGQNTRTGTSPFTTNTRGIISFDMRTQTEYGTLRSYIDGGGTVSSTDAWANGANQNSSTSFLNTRAFIQFAGFTAGRMRSFFDMYFQGTYAFAGQRFGNDTSPNGITGIAYTWQFGGGLSASLSLEDNSGANSGRGRSTVNLSSPALSLSSTSTFDDKGLEFFDPVFNLRLDQAWGFVGVSAALHDASGGYYSNTTAFPCAGASAGTSGANQVLETCGHPGDKFGWAVSPAFLWNNPFGLTGDAIAAQGVWSVGAQGYAVAQNSATAFFKSGTNLGFGFGNEGIFTNGSNVELTTVWSWNAAYEHRWNPQWRTSIYGGMLGYQYDGAATAMICNAFGSGITGITKTATFNCDANWSMSEVGSRTLWNPVPDLDVGFDVVWYHLNTAFSGSVLNFTSPVGAKPAGLYTVSNVDSLGAVFRIQRNFLY
jgi:Porin subfamily